MPHLIPVREPFNAPHIVMWDDVKDIDISIPGANPIAPRLWHSGAMATEFTVYSLSIISADTAEEALAKEWLGNALLKQIDDTKPFAYIKGISKLTSVIRPDIGTYITNVEISYRVGN